MTKRQREDDETTLHILDLKMEGLTPEQIGRRVGISARNIRRRMNRVVADDCLHDPEAESYWKGVRQ